MVKMKKMIMVVMIVLVSCLIISMGFDVQATGVADDPITLNGLDIITTPTDDTANQIIANEMAANAIYESQVAANQIVANQIAANQIIQPTTNVTTNSVGNTLPQTGVTEDITVMFFIIVCVISAIYAYKKIRDYNA